jgi:hypothetical protein
MRIKHRHWETRWHMRIISVVAIWRWHIKNKMKKDTFESFASHTVRCVLYFLRLYWSLHNLLLSLCLRARKNNIAVVEIRVGNLLKTINWTGITDHYHLHMLLCQHSKAVRLLVRMRLHNATAIYTRFADAFCRIWVIVQPAPFCIFLYLL